MRGAARDLHSGSGLTANRKNLPNASELCLAFDWVSRSSRPALCYRPLLAFAPRLSTLSVTQLEPRTLHQPEKLKKLSKNDPVVLFLILESIKSVRIYPVYFQSSAGGPQRGDRKWCSETGRFCAERKPVAGFRRCGLSEGGDAPFVRTFARCENLVKAALGKGFAGTLEFRSLKFRAGR